MVHSPLNSGSRMSISPLLASAIARPTSPALLRETGSVCRGKALPQRCRHAHSALYSKLLTSPLDTGLEQEYTCSMKLLNKPGKVCLIHPARPIKKARTSLALLLSETDHERVALRAPQYKG